MSEETARLVGWEEAERALNALAPELALKLLDSAGRAGMDTMLQYARAGAPVRSGATRRGIKVRKMPARNGLTRRFALRGSPGLHLLVFGTKAHDIKPVRSAALAIAPNFFRRGIVRHPGTKPDDFFVQALRAHVPEIVERMRQVLLRGLPAVVRSIRQISGKTYAPKLFYGPGGAP